MATPVTPREDPTRSRLSGASDRFDSAGSGRSVGVNVAGHDTDGNDNKNQSWGTRLRHKIRQTINAFRQLSVRHLVISVAVGTFGGLFPVPGITTFACILLASLLRLPAAGHIVVQAINFSITPIDIIMVPYFACFGMDLVAGTVTHPFSSSQVGCRTEVLAILPDILEHPLSALKRFLSTFMAGILGWIVIGLALAAVLLPLSRRLPAEHAHQH